ncbi:late control protein D [Salmonella enterica]|nr:late control protein D [Salmonella enterica]
MGITAGDTVEFAPDFSLSAEGRDITAAVASGLVELQFTDYGAGTGKTDELRITLMSETLVLPAKGAKLRFGLGFNGVITDKGSFVVCGVASSGPPRKVEIYATAAPMDGKKHGGNVNNQKTRSFPDDITLGDLVRTVAADNGLTARVAAGLKDIVLPHVDQVRESDAALLSRLARLHNAVSKPTHDRWLFLVRGAGESVSGRAVPHGTVSRENVSSWNYSAGDRGNAGAGKGKGTVAVDYFHKQTGETRTLQVTHDGADRRHPYTHADDTQAKQQAGAMVISARQNARRMSLTAPCRPEFIALTAEGAITTTGFGRKEDRRWLTESLCYRLGAAGFSVEFSLVTDFRPPGKNNGVDYFNKH